MDQRPKDRKNALLLRRPSGQGAALPFVGRDEELRHLTGALTRAAEGNGSTVLLTGQPGIGRSRLAREALALAKTHGFMVLEGRAFPLQGGMAYAPLVNAFRPLLRSWDPARLTALVSSLPDLGRLFAGLDLPIPQPLGDPGLEKTRLFESVSRFLELLSQKAPVALFIDDLHRADLASLELLHYLARGLLEQRTLLVATYAVDAFGAFTSLQEFVRSLKRDGLAHEIAIPRLRPGAVERLVQSMLGGEAPANLLDLVETRARGTPLFVEAIVNALIDAGTLVRTVHGWVIDSHGASNLPPSIRHLIVDRLHRIPPADRRLLDFLAVMGDATTHTVLRTASCLGEENLIESLRRLIATGLVAEEMDELDSTYHITHPLIQEVVYAELPGATRRRAHIAAIGAIESFQGKHDMNRLARHYHAAGIEADPARSLEVILAAGERARAIYANEEAERHYSAALAIVREGRLTEAGWCRWVLSGHGGDDLPSTLSPQPSTLSELLLWLLERQGEALERIGRPGAAVEKWEEALAERERAGDAIAASRLRRQLALAERDRGNFEIADAHLRAGLAALVLPRRDKPCQELADLHFARFYILSRLEDMAGQAETAAELLTVARQLASPRAEGEANLVASVSSSWQGNVVRSRRYASRALVIGEQAQELAICCRAHSALAMSGGLRLGDHQFMRDHAERGLALAQRLGAPTMEVSLRIRLALAHLMSGAWDESLCRITQAIVLARRLGDPRGLAHSLAGQGIILMFRGDLPEAEACISEARTARNSVLMSRRYVSDLVDIAEAALALERADVKCALSIARNFISPSAQTASPTRLAMAYAPMGLMLLAEAQVAAGDTKSALRTSRKLIGLSPSGTPYYTALASRAEGLARHARGQWAAAIDCLTRANETFTTLGMPFEAARCLLEQAASALPGRAEKPELASRAARQSLVLFERLGAHPYISGARRLLRELGVSPPASRRARLSGGALSHRELEIARLVADGLTTADIAQRLTLSRHTIDTHLGHIFARLGIGSRAALTRYVVETGLLLLRDDK